MFRGGAGASCTDRGIFINARSEPEGGNALKPAIRGSGTTESERHEEKEETNRWQSNGKKSWRGSFIPSRVAGMLFSTSVVHRCLRRHDAHAISYLASLQPCAGVSFKSRQDFSSLSVPCVPLQKTASSRIRSTGNQFHPRIDQFSFLLWSPMDEEWLLEGPSEYWTFLVTFALKDFEPSCLLSFLR